MKLHPTLPCSPQRCPSLRGRGAARPPYRGGHTPNPLPLNGSAALPYGGGARPTPHTGVGNNQPRKPSISADRKPDPIRAVAPGRDQIVPATRWGSKIFLVRNIRNRALAERVGLNPTGGDILRRRPGFLPRAFVGQWSKTNPCSFFLGSLLQTLGSRATS